MGAGIQGDVNLWTFLVNFFSFPVFFFFFFFFSVGLWEWHEVEDTGSIVGEIFFRAVFVVDSFLFYFWREISVF